MTKVKFNSGWIYEKFKAIAGEVHNLNDEQFAAGKDLKNPDNGQPLFEITTEPTTEETNNKIKEGRNNNEKNTEDTEEDQ